MKAIISLLFISILSVVCCDAADTLFIEPTVRSLYVRAGEYQELNCYANTSSTNEPVWEMPSLVKETDVSSDRLASSSGKGKVTNYHGTLKITSFSQHYVGQYTCKIEIPGVGGAAPTSLSSKITLELMIEDKTTAVFTLDAASATLSCDLQLGEGKVEEVVWLKNDTAVTDLKDSDRFKSHVENHSLVITKPIRADADLYIARYTIKDMDTPVDCEVEYFASPLVLDFDKSKNLIQGDKMELHCKVKGYPRIPVTWMKNEKPLNTSAGGNKHIALAPFEGFDNARLIIKMVEFDDAGDYTCTAFSAKFNQTSHKTITVRVKDKLAALWPFLGIVAEVIILCTIIFIYEKRRNKQVDRTANNDQETDGSTNNKKESSLRYRNTPSNNPTA